MVWIINVPQRLTCKDVVSRWWRLYEALMPLSDWASWIGHGAMPLGLQPLLCLSPSQLPYNESFASHTHLTMMSLATGPNTAELTNHGLNQQKRQAKVCVNYLWYLVTAVGSWLAWILFIKGIKSKANKNQSHQTCSPHGWKFGLPSVFVKMWHWVIYNYSVVDPCKFICS